MIMSVSRLAEMKKGQCGRKLSYGLYSHRECIFFPCYRMTLKRMSLESNI